MYDRDESAGIGAAVGHAVMLHFDDNLLQSPRFSNVAEHTVQPAFFLDVAHEDKHPAAFFQRSELLIHAVIHLLYKIRPSIAPRKVVLSRIESVPLDDIICPVHLIGVDNK